MVWHTLRKRLTTPVVELPADATATLQAPAVGGETITVLPPHPTTEDTVPSTIDTVIRSLYTASTDWTGLRNQSPVYAFELRRMDSDTLTLQFTVPTRQAARTLRTQLAQTVPGIGFKAGATGIPVSEGLTVGGAVLTPTKESYYPLRQDYPQPPLNAVCAALHRHAMQNTRVVMQVLFQPWAGQPLRTRLHRWLAREQEQYLRKDKERLWGRRSATQHEREQARMIERKRRHQAWRCSIRVLVLGSGEYTASRLHELTKGFHAFTHPQTEQALQTRPIRVWPFRKQELSRFAQAVARREFGGTSRPFRVSPTGLGALCSIPDRDQQNLSYAQL